MRKAKSINLVKLLSHNIATREAAELVRDSINKDCQKISINFAGVSFISRSFASEMSEMRKNIEKKHCSVVWLNTSNDIERMFKVVEARSEKPSSVKLKSKRLRDFSYQF